MGALEGREREQQDSPVELGWKPLDLTAEGVQISDLLKKCSWVDHSVPAVTHMRGGSQVWPAPGNTNKMGQVLLTMVISPAGD